MILLDAVVQIAVGPMQHLATQYLADGPGVGVVTIGGYSFWRAAGDFLGLPKEFLGYRHVALLAQHGVHQIAVPVDGPIQVMPLAGHFDVCLVDVPALPRRLERSCSLMSGAKRSSQSRTVSWVNSKPRTRNISARSRRLNL